MEPTKELHWKVQVSPFKRSSPPGGEVVTNCSDQHRFRDMAKILGLESSVRA